MPLDGDERVQLRRLRESLHGWGLGDIRRAADCGAERLAFIGLAAWTDVVSGLHAGELKKGQGQNQWARFFKRYAPKYKRHAATLHTGLRNALLHEYGTRKVGLTHEPKDADAHLTTRHDLLVLHLPTMIEDYERAFEKMCMALENHAAERARVLPAAKGLLARVDVPGLTPSVTGGINLAALSATASMEPHRWEPPDTSS